MIIWNCTIIHRDLDRASLPPGCDAPMRDAVEAAFVALTGTESEALSSGWGQSYLTEHELAVLDGRVPSPEFYECWAEAEVTLADLEVAVGEDFTPTHERYMNALSALAEALFASRAGLPSAT
jgi:hypothetical protein